MITTQEEPDEQGDSSSRSESENANSDDEEKTPVFTGDGVKRLGTVSAESFVMIALVARARIPEL